MDTKPVRILTRKQFLKRTTGAAIGTGIAGFAAPAFIPKIEAAPNIEFRKLGSSGISVSAVGLGATRLSEPSLVKRILDMGITFIDTGRMYSQGRNEEMIGRVIGASRKNYVIQSKIDQKIQRDAAAMMKSIDDSLKALKTDFIDIMLIRGATTEEAVKNDIVADVFAKAKQAGKIRLCGFSAHSANAPEMVRLGVDYGVYDVMMVPYNHTGSFTHSIYGIYSEWDQDALHESFALAASRGKSIVAMKSCSGGPRKEEGESEETYRSALKWALKNKHVSAVFPAIASFREAEEDIGAMA